MKDEHSPEREEKVMDGGREDRLAEEDSDDMILEEERGPAPADEERHADDKLVPKPAPGIGPIGPGGDPSYMEGTLRGRGPRVGLYVTVGVVAALVLVAIALVVAG
jgi:hypothetical protein